MHCKNIKRIRVIKGDITQIEADAIVNAANTFLLGGRGVDGAIHKAAGQELLNDCKRLNGCKTGKAKLTKGHNLMAKYIIHTVGPKWRYRAPYEDMQLKNCYRSSLLLANENGIKTIAFPCISTGSYGFPNERAAYIAIRTCAEMMQEIDIREVIFVCYQEMDYLIYNRILRVTNNLTSKKH